MSKPGTLTDIPWADARYDFCLRIGEVRQLQEKTGVGPLALLRRVQSGDWMVDDLRETLRLGLIGAGREQTEASKLVETHFDPPDYPKAQHVTQVTAILMAWLFGLPKSKKSPQRR